MIDMCSHLATEWFSLRSGGYYRHTPSLCLFHRKVFLAKYNDLLDVAVTQLCPVVMEHSHCARPVRSS
jgi:hypothetical protein